MMPMMQPTAAAFAQSPGLSPDAWSKNVAAIPTEIIEPNAHASRVVMLMLILRPHQRPPN
jgi:hypothetical protein